MYDWQCQLTSRMLRDLAEAHLAVLDALRARPVAPAPRLRPEVEIEVSA